MNIDNDDPSDQCDKVRAKVFNSWKLNFLRESLRVQMVDDPLGQFPKNVFVDERSISTLIGVMFDGFFPCFRENFFAVECSHLARRFCQNLNFFCFFFAKFIFIY